MPPVLDTFGITDVGLKRDHNEDHLYLNDDLGLYIVADGMGGHAAGEVASRTAVNSISAFIYSSENERDFTWPFGVDNDITPQENLLLSGIKLANREICALAQEKKEYNGMGTTIAGLQVDEKMVYYAHVGDSRIYRYRNDVLEQLTSDHSWVNEQLGRNLITEEEARNHRWRNVITRALGNKYTIEVDLGRADIHSGDVFLMCTDGLSGMIPNEEIHRILRASNQSSELASRRLLQRANEAGGHDNITVLVIRVESVEGEEVTDLSDVDTQNGLSEADVDSTLEL